MHRACGIVSDGLGSDVMRFLNCVRNVAFSSPVKTVPASGTHTCSNQDVTVVSSQTASFVHGCLAAFGHMSEHHFVRNQSDIFK